MFSPWDSAVLPAHPLNLQLALVDDLLQADRISMPDLSHRIVLVSSLKSFVLPLNELFPILTTSTKPDAIAKCSPNMPSTKSSWRKLVTEP